MEREPGKQMSTISKIKGGERKIQECVCRLTGRVFWPDHHLKWYLKLSLKETVSPCRLHSGGKKAINTSLSHHKYAVSCSTHLQLRPGYELIIHHQRWCIRTLRYGQGSLKSPLTSTAVGSAAHFWVRDVWQPNCYIFLFKETFTSTSIYTQAWHLRFS